MQKRISSSFLQLLSFKTFSFELVTCGKMKKVEIVGKEKCSVTFMTLSGQSYICMILQFMNILFKFVPHSYSYKIPHPYKPHLCRRGCARTPQGGTTSYILRVVHQFIHIIMHCLLFHNTMSLVQLGSHCNQQPPLQYFSIAITLHSAFVHDYFQLCLDLSFLNCIIFFSKSFL